MSHPASTVKFDIRPLPPSERHPLIFSAFNKLGTGQAMELINDHDPKPLHDQFQAELAGKFAWDYLEQGPGTWRVAITKLPLAHNSGGCCGGCGGG